MSGLVLQVFKTQSFVDFSNERYKGESMLRFSSSASVLGDGLQWRTKQFTKDALDDLKNLEILELFFSDIDPNSIDFTSFITHNLLRTIQGLCNYKKKLIISN